MIQGLLSDEELAGCPLLVFANKMDLGILSTGEIIEGLNLREIRGRDWFCQGSSALTGAGVYEGMEWFCKKMNNKNR